MKRSFLRAANHALKLLACLLLVGAGLGIPAQAKKTGKTERPVGYLAPAAIPSSLLQLPPPPQPGSAAQLLDEEIARRSLTLRGTPRWELAIEDADLSFPHAAGMFACALGVAITEADTPHVLQLLARSARDLGASTRDAKRHYQRQRPFLGNGEPICTPEVAARIAREGSYPSGHATTVWGWALVLAELAPGQADALMIRGRAAGESRNVCNAHWHSDVMQGRLLAAGVVARLHADKQFQADMEAARGELAEARSHGLSPGRDCAAEAAALAITPSLAQ